MCYKPVLLLLIFLKAFTSFAMQADTLKVFYDIGKSDLTPGDMNRITEFIRTFSNTDTLKISGYADYLGDESDNVYLSFDRAKAIKTFVISLGTGKNFLMITAGKGEISATGKTTASGEPLNRRVDLIRTPMFTKASVAAKPTRQVQGRSTVTLPSLQQRQGFRNKIEALANLDKGNSLSLPEITFQPGRHYINPEAMPYVDLLLAYLIQHNSITFEIHGHICCVNNEGDSQDYDTGQNGLSTNRAKAVYDYFAQNGISTSRMNYKGLGSSEPKVWPELSEHDRYLNRRVEIMVLSK
jgi:outer membrane protein OmpA-like peptidoglycan-associated protein